MLLYSVSPTMFKWIKQVFLCCIIYDLGTTGLSLVIFCISLPVISTVMLLLRQHQKLAVKIPERMHQKYLGSRIHCTVLQGNDSPSTRWTQLQSTTRIQVHTVKNNGLNILTAIILF